jgi:glycosyltransferase involved in cell wall biosynthesis
MTDPVAARYVVLIPSYNTGAKLFETVAEARRFHRPVWVVIDGSTDGAADALRSLAKDDPDLSVHVLARNQGKGAAVLHGLRIAQAQGFTHVLTMDADGQHNAADIPRLIALSAAQPDAMVLGRPIFDASAPAVRVAGRRVANLLANIETVWAGIGDALFGLRVYPVAPLLLAFQSTRWMRRFDFDAEAAIRLCWLRVRPINVATRVRYFRPDQGGVSHFHYLRDNLLLSFMFLRLLVEMLPRLVLAAIRSSRR